VFFGDGSGETMKINIGSGSVPLPDYLNLDRKSGDEAFPLSHNGVEIEDESVDVIRASHILEHFSHTEAPEVIKHWASKLKTGGVLKIAVPDFDWCVEQYTSGSQAPLEAYLMGGQTDGDDYHKSLFNERTLVDYFRAANLTDIGKWDADANDCSRLPVSLNMRAVKPAKIDKMPRIVAAMSMPRVHWTANHRCTVENLSKLGIPLQTYEGVYWGQCLERGFDDIISGGADAILTIDFDTLFSGLDVLTLVRLFLLNQHTDAICAMQQARGWDSVLATVDLPPGTEPGRVPANLFDADLLKLKTGHFGLTLIRASSLRDVKKPWFLSTPSKDGSWGDGHEDEDIYFWRNWERCGKTLYCANRVAVGHVEAVIKWPGRDLGGIYQRVPDYWKSGKPKDAWK
jgi:predicted SAM-dependent methyltransferase